MVATKNRPQSGNATAENATIDLLEEEDKDGLAHMALVPNGEESADKRFAGMGK